MSNQHTENALTGLYPKCSSRALKRAWLRKGRIKIQGSCWLWLGSRNRDGYGTIGVAGSVKLVHRVVYEMCKGAIDKDEVCHNCPGGDQPACCNPAHLFAGTHLDNMQDAARKGRIKPRDSRGSKNPVAVLTEERVRQIRRRAAMLGTRRGVFVMLGTEFSVTGSTISRVVRRKIWTHVE